MKILSVCCISLNFLLLSASSLMDQITQTPAHVFKHAGEKAEIKCSHSIQSYDNGLWYKQSEDGQMQLLGYMISGSAFPESGLGVTMGGSADKDQTFTLTIAGISEGSRAVYFCAAREQSSYNEAYFGAGTKLTVLEAGINVTAPTRVKVLSPSEKECSSGKKTLVCVASGFYPDHVSVSWMINEETVSKGVATDSAATRYGTSYRITSRLTVSSEEWTSDNKFICSVSFFNGTTTTYHNDSITGEAKKSPSGTELSRDKYLRITQSAKLSYIIFIVKSCIYGAFIWFVAWKLQSLAEKKRKR